LSKRGLVGQLGQHSIYRVEKVSFICLANTKKQLTAEQEEDEAKYLSMLRDLLDSGSFYFSYTYDLSNTTERNTQFSKERSNTLQQHNVWQNGDERFIWNSHLQQIFCQKRKEIESFGMHWIVPIIQGFISIRNDCHVVNTTTKNKSAFTFALISRRSKRRAGTRYHSRGSDAEGNVSNYVETEQILQTESTQGVKEFITTSFVQIR
jgi:hypothetical protein